MLGELALVGALAAFGIALAILLVEAAGLSMPIDRTLLVLPIAVALSVIAGLAPAWTAREADPSTLSARPYAAIDEPSA